MKTKIKFLQDYKTFKTGETGLVTKEAAEELIASGHAEIVASDVEVTKEIENITKTVEDAVEKAVAVGIKTIPMPKIEVKEEIPYTDNTGGFLLDIKAMQNGEKMTDELNKYKNFVETKAPSGNNTLIDTEGGYLVPEEFSTSLIMQMNEESQIAPRTRQIPINRRIKLPYINDSDRSGSAVGGVDVTWNNEGSTLTSSKAQFKQVELELKKIHALTYATDELLSDSAIAVESVMSQLAGTALAREHDEVIVNGTGAGRPLGFMNSPALITVAKETSQTADTIVSKNIYKMWERISDSNNAVWLINRSALPQIYQLNQEVSTAGGSSLFVFNIAERQSETILGAPIIWTDHAAAIGDLGDIMLCDLSQYLTATKAGGPKIKSATSIHVKFLTDEVAFRFTMRVDGQPWWPSAQTPKRGNTISPFVTLAARA